MNEDRNTYIGSRDFVLNRSWVTELWMKVIQKAIDDLATFTRTYEDGEKLSDEEKMYADTAYGFLFDPEYAIDLGGYDITLEELLEFWGCESVNRWREDLRERIKVLVVEKRAIIEARRNNDASSNR